MEREEIKIEYRENEETGEYKGYFEYEGRLHMVLDFKQKPNRESSKRYKRINEIIELEIEIARG